MGCKRRPEREREPVFGKQFGKNIFEKPFGRWHGPLGCGRRLEPIHSRRMPSLPHTFLSRISCWRVLSPMLVPRAFGRADLSCIAANPLDSLRWVSLLGVPVAAGRDCPIPLTPAGRRIKRHHPPQTTCRGGRFERSRPQAACRLELIAKPLEVFPRRPTPLVKLQKGDIGPALENPPREAREHT